MRKRAPETKRLGPRTTARLYQLLTEEERQALGAWHAEWVHVGGDYRLGDWPGWHQVLERVHT